MQRRRAIVWPLISLVIGVFAGILLKLTFLLNLTCLVPALVIIAIAGLIQDKKKRLSDLMKRAGRLHGKGDRDQASELYQKVRTIDPTLPRACLEVGHYYAETDRPEQAESAYRSALQGVEEAIQSTRRRFPWRTWSVIPDTDGVGRTTVHIALSRLFERQGQLDLAVEEAQTALESARPTEAEWWLKWLPKRAKKIPRVLAVLLAIQALISVFNVSIELVPTARLFFGETSEMLDSVSLLLLGAFLFTLFQFLLAGIEIVLPVAVWTRHRLAGYGVIGVCVAQAAEIFLETLQNGGEETAAGFVSNLNVISMVFSLLLLALAVISLNEYGKHHFDTIRAQVHSRLAALFSSLGDKEKAGQHQEQAEQLDPTLAQEPPDSWAIDEREPLSRRQRMGMYVSIILVILLVCGGSILTAHMGWTTIATETNPALAEIYPMIAQKYLDRGNNYARSGDLTRAIDDYNRVLELLPDSADAYLNRGLAYAHAGDMEQAFSDYAQAIELNPEFALAYSNRGNLYRVSGNLDQAIADYDRAIELDPEFAQAYFSRGLVYAISGNLEQALLDYTRAIELDPDYVEAYFERGNVHFNSGDIESAISDYDQVVASSPGFAQVYLNRGRAHANLGEREQAIADMERYLELAPEAENREQVRGMIQELSVVARYVHPSGAFGFTLLDGWEVYQESEPSALVSDGISLAGAEFHDVGAVYTEDEMRAYAADFVGAVLGEYQLETLEIQPEVIYVSATFTANDGQVNWADFIFDQHETVIFIFLFITPAEAYDQNLPLRDIILASYRVDPEAARANP